MDDHAPTDINTFSGRSDAVAPPYISFNTFRTLLDWLRSEGVPLRFDRSFWQAKFSGSNGTQLVAALRFLGLLGGDSPLPDLENLVKATFEDRRFILAVVLKDSYTAVSFDELDRATPAMVRDWFRSYPIDGHTMRKAVSFFVNAAKEAELPMSNAVRKMAKSKRGGASRDALAREGHARRRATSSDATSERHTMIQGGQAGPAGERKSIPRSQTLVRLESGGTVTVDLALDLFKISERDREFVLKLVDLTRSYAEQRGDAPAERNDTPADS